MTSKAGVYGADTSSGQGAPAAESTAFLRGFVGSAILLLVIRAAEPVFFGDGYFSTLTYHPFWMVVLLAAVQHGLFVGVTTVGLATLMMDWPLRPVGVDISAYYVEIGTMPTQWLIVALLIGSYRQAQIRRDQQVRNDNARLTEINDTLSSEIHRLDAALARAELSAVTRADASRVPSRRVALDALAQLSGAAAADRAEAFAAAARACSDAEIAWVDFPSLGGIVLVAATHAETRISASVTARNLLACAEPMTVFCPGEGLAPVDRSALFVPVAPAGSSEPVGGVVAFADDANSVPDLTSTTVLLACALEAALDSPPPPRALVPSCDALDLRPA